MSSEILKSAINAHWLRPDNALWVNSFSQTFGEECKKFVKNSKNTIDIGCGDGTTSFIMLEGQFGDTFDIFRDVQANDENLYSKADRSSTGSLDDSKGDFYNTYSKKWKQSLKIKQRPLGKYGFGTDWKKALIDKAVDLDLYENTLVHDSNITPFPFKENNFDFIFSTIIYWLADTKKTLSAINKLLCKDGIFAFSCPNENITNFTLHSMISKYDYPKLDRLDRGRHANWKRHARSRDQWENEINSSGFKVVDYKQFNSSLQIAMGETIIRTMLKSYMVLYDKLVPNNEDILLDFKKSWVDEIYTLLEPFDDKKWLEKKEHDYLYHAFFVQKK